MEMKDKAIKGLECCGYSRFMDKCQECPYDGKDCFHRLKNDALALLKAQEPRVMMLEEAKSAYVVEFRSGKMHEVGAALLNLIVDPLNTEYGKIYRVWTSRPTDEQREAIPWN